MVIVSYEVLNQNFGCNGKWNYSIANHAMLCVNQNSIASKKMIIIYTSHRISDDLKKS